jgi:hypothetical protein
LVTPYRMSGKRGKNDAADAAAIRDVGHWHNRWSGRFGHKPENTLPSNSLVAPASLYTKAFCSVCGSSASLRGATASLRRGRARSRRAPVIARGL